MTNNSENMNINTQTGNIPESPITFTLHLPGLKKTMKMTYNIFPIKNEEVKNFIFTTFNIVPRRAKVFVFPKDEDMLPIDLYDHHSLISDGDTLIVCVRGTTVAGENEYYDNQEDSLLHNKYLDPPISKNYAKSLLIQIAMNFEFYGHKYHLPGGRWYEYKQYLSGLMDEHYDK